LGSPDVIGHVTIRLPGVNFIWVVHSDHASVLHSYGDMAFLILDARTWTRKKRRKKAKRKKTRDGEKKEKSGRKKVKEKSKGKK